MGVFTGRVTKSGQALGGLSVSAIKANSSGYGTTDTNGYYTTNQIPLGTYQLTTGYPDPTQNCSVSTSASLSSSSKTVDLVVVCTGVGTDTATPTTCGSLTCSTTQHCSTTNTCIDNCSELSCSTGQTCSATTKECQAAVQTQHEINLSIGVKTDCTEAACTNRDSHGKVNSIPVSFGTFSGVTENSLAIGYNLEFQRVMTGNYTFKINDPSQTGYNSAYESKTVTQNVYVPIGSTFVEFKLAKKPVVYQAATFDFIGIAKDSQGNVVTSAFINLNPVGCVGSSTFLCPYNKNTRSGTAPADNHGVTTALNYSITGLYNIAQTSSKFLSYTGTIGLTGYTGSSFTISASDIKVDSNGRSYFYKELLINPILPSTPTIGTATAGSSSATVSFTPPTNNASSAITGYTVTSSPGNITATGTASPINVTGLTDGTSYTFTVHSTSSVGNSPESAKSNAVVPIVTPPPNSITKFDLVGKVTVGNTGALYKHDLTLRINYSPRSLISDFSYSGASCSDTYLANRAGQSEINCVFTDVPYSPDYGYWIMDPDGYTISSSSLTGAQFDIKQTGSIFYARKDYSLKNHWPALKIISKTNGGALANTSVKIKTPACDKINETVSTNAKGELILYESEYAKVLSGMYSECLPLLQFTFEKDGYVTVITEFNPVANIATEEFITVSSVLQPITAESSGTISGKITVTKSSDAIAGAKINLWKAPIVFEDPLQNISSDNNGKFNFSKLTKGNYALSVFKPGFSDTGRGRISISFDPAKPVFIDLQLDRLIQGDSSLLKTAFLDAASKETLFGKLTITRQDGTKEGAEVGVNGQFKVKNSETINLKAELAKDLYRSWTQGVSAQKTVVIPSDYSKWSSSRQRAFEQANFFYFNSPQTVNSWTFNVVDNKDKPIKDARVIVVIDRHNGLGRLAAGLPFLMSATTSELGLATFPGSFTYLNIEGGTIDIDARLRVTGLSRGTSVYVTVVSKDQQQDYESLKLPASGNKIVLKLDSPRPKDEGTITVDFSELVQTSFADLQGSDFYLEKKGTTGWNRVNVEGTVDEKSVDFVGLEKGWYRAKSQEDGPEGGPVYFDGESNEEINIGACPNDNDNFHLVDFGSGVSFAFTDELYDQYENNADKKLFYQKSAQSLIGVRAKTPDIGPVIVSFANGGSYNAFFAQQSYFCKGKSQRFIQINKELLDGVTGANLESLVNDAIAHEYGHAVFQSMRENPNFTNFFNKWVNLFREITSSNSNQCVFGKIKDGNIGLDPGGFMGHPADDYGGMLPGDEMFASFFHGYFSAHGTFYQIIKFQTEENSECQNILAYMWQNFAESVGKVDPSDNVVFKPVGGSLSNAPFSFDQVGSGSWRQKSFATMSFSNRLQAYETRYLGSLVRTASAFAINARLKVLNAYSDISQTGDKGKVSGLLYDKNSQPLKDYVVQIGSKYALTNDKGRFVLEGVKTGKQPIAKPLNFRKNVLKEMTSPATLSGQSSPLLTVVKGQTTTITIKLK